MATKQFYATGSFKYGTRMLRAGDPVELDAPNARLFAALGKISPDKPRAAKAPDTNTLSVNEVPVATVTAGEKIKITPKKTTPRKRAKKRATAKK